MMPSTKPSKSVRRYRRWIWLLLPIVLWWIFRQVPLNDVVAVLRTLNPGAILALVLVNAGVLALFSSRWWLILRAKGQQVAYLALAGFRLAAFAIAYFTPGPHFGGEPLQVYLLNRRESVPTDTALASVALDKLLDLLANLTFLLLGLIILFTNGLLAADQHLPALLLACGLIALPAGYLFSLWLGFAPLSRLLDRLPSRLPVFPAVDKTRRIVVSAEAQIGRFCRQQPGTLAAAVLLSAITWAALIAEYWLALRFLGLTLTLNQTIIMMAAARLAYLTPLPGGLGALEASQALAISYLGADPAIGISLVLLIRARDVTLGLLGLWWGGVLTRRSRNQYATSPASD